MAELNDDDHHEHHCNHQHRHHHHLLVLPKCLEGVRLVCGHIMKLVLAMSSCESCQLQMRSEQPDFSN